MAEILSIEGNKVKIGTNDGKILTVPIATLNFSAPKIGDKVKIYSDKSTYFVTRSEKKNESATKVETNKINKHIFVWICNFLFGCFGVDRMVRGQVGTGLCKLLFGWLTIGIWPLIDWIISMVKAYGVSFGSVQDITFDQYGNYTK